MKQEINTDIKELYQKFKQREIKNLVIEIHDESGKLSIGIFGNDIERVENIAVEKIEGGFDFSYVTLRVFRAFETLLSNEKNRDKFESIPQLAKIRNECEYLAVNYPHNREWGEMFSEHVYFNSKEELEEAIEIIIEIFTDKLKNPGDYDYNNNAMKQEINKEIEELYQKFKTRRKKCLKISIDNKNGELDIVLKPEDLSEYESISISKVSLKYEFDYSSFIIYSAFDTFLTKKNANKIKSVQQLSEIKDELEAKKSKGITDNKKWSEAYYPDTEYFTTKQELEKAINVIIDIFIDKIKNPEDYQFKHFL